MWAAVRRQHRARATQHILRLAGQFHHSPLDALRPDRLYHLDHRLHGVQQRERQHAAFIPLRLGRELRRAMMQILVIAPILVAAPPDHRRRQPLAQLRTDIHETRAIGREQPLIRIHREQVRPDARYVELQRAQALRAIQIQQDPAPPQRFRNLLERRPETGRIIYRADGHQPRARRKRIVEALPRRLHEFHAAAAEVRRIVIVVRELVFQSDDLVARLPIQTAQQQRQPRRRIVNERDVRGLAANVFRDARANAVGVAEPLHEIGAGQFVPPREVLRHRLGRPPRHLPKRRRVQIGPFRQRRKLAADFCPVHPRPVSRHHAPSPAPQPAPPLPPLARPPSSCRAAPPTPPSPRLPSCLP